MMYIEDQEKRGRRGLYEFAKSSRNCFGCFSRIGNCYILLSREKHGFTCVVGPHWPGTFLTVLMVCGGAYMTFSALSLKSRHLSVSTVLGFQSFSGLAIASTLVFLFLCALTDSGTVVLKPHHSVDNASADDEEVSPSEWCSICNVAQSRGRQIYHCKDCDLCIEGHDHHCPWIGKCIGKGNMTWFLAFNASWISAMISMLIITLAL